MEKINKQRVYNYLGKKNKWKGIIDYKTLFFTLTYICIVLKIVFSFGFSFTTKLYISLNLILPLIIFILLNINEENIIDKLIIILKFTLNKKMYVKMKYFSKEKAVYKINVEK